VFSNGLLNFSLYLSLLFSLLVFTFLKPARDDEQEVGYLARRARIAPAPRAKRQGRVKVALFQKKVPRKGGKKSEKVSR
jgi:hypothetical protein